MRVGDVFKVREVEYGDPPGRHRYHLVPPGEKRRIPPWLEMDILTPVQEQGAWLRPVLG